MTHLCNDYGDCSRCLKDADEQYTMRFDDIGAEPIYWCSYCGPIAEAAAKALMNISPEEFKRLAVEVQKAYDERVLQ